MTVNWYFVAFSLLLSGCMGVFGADKPKSSNDMFWNVDDPFGISCIYNESMTGFHQVNVTRNSKISPLLVDRLTNGRPLALYVDGFVSRIKASGSTFKFAKEWFKASNSNICYLTYAYEKNSKNAFSIITTPREMIKSNRSLHAAEIASELILDMRENCIKNANYPSCYITMSQITVLGFSFGAHIASQICINVYKNTKEKVGKLIGIDPAGIYLTVKYYNQSFISRGQASYVEIIHTDTLLFGTSLQSGDIDIYVQDLPVGILDKHGFGPYLHMATAMKKLLLVAEKTGIGKLIQLDTFPDLFDRYPNKNEAYIGVYSESEYCKRGQKFYFSLKNRIEVLRDSIAHVVKMTV